jgi:hypothetical protein
MIQDKIAKVIRQTISIGRRSPDELAYAIVAELPNMLPKLVWEDPIGEIREANSFGKKIQIMWDRCPRNGIHYVLYPGTNERKVFSSLKKAKEVANEGHVANFIIFMNW